MQIQLHELSLRNFKGIKEETIRFDGHDVIVSGANGTGKTSLFDSWLWLLFDMDSAGHKGSDAVKTTKGADFAHFLTHEVSAAISIDGRMFVIRKTLEEKWVKPRGQEKQEFSGNVASYWVDQVPKQKKDFDQFVDTLVPVELFKILSDPLYFSTELHYKVRLAMLVEMCGGITEREIADVDPALNALLDKVEGKTLDDYKKMIQEQRRRLDTDIQGAQTRIDEQNRTLSQASAQDYSNTEAESGLALCTAGLRQIETQELNTKEAIKPLLAAQEKLARLKAQREELIVSLVDKANADYRQLDEKIQDEASNLRKITRSISDIEGDTTTCQETIAHLEGANNRLRAEIKEINALARELAAREIVRVVTEDECPTCGQKLPDDEIDRQIRQTTERFNADKEREESKLKARYDQINAEGKANAGKIDKLKSAIISNQSDLEEFKRDFSAAQSLVDDLNDKKLHYRRVLPTDVARYSEVEIIDAEITNLQVDISRPAAETSSEDFARRKADIQAEIDKCRKVIYAHDAETKTRERIQELETEVKTKAAAKSILDGDLYQLDRFVIARTQMLENKINRLFTRVSFKFFKEQVNGGIEETCEAVVGETTFGKANTASQVNAGLDIIGAISRHKDIRVPVFCDRLESINDLLQIDSQQISLLVTTEPALTVKGS